MSIELAKRGYEWRFGKSQNSKYEIIKNGELVASFPNIRSVTFWMKEVPPRPRSLIKNMPEDVEYGLGEDEYESYQNHLKITGQI